MRKTFVGLLLVVGLLNAAPSFGVVGLYDAGNHLISPPLWVDNNNTGPQYLSQIFSSDPDWGLPNGTTISPWNYSTLSYEPASTFSTSSGWSIDYDLSVGIGALMWMPVLYTNTYVGEVDVDWPINNTVAASLPHTNLPSATGYYLLGNRVPIQPAGFEEIIGRAPADGEQIVTLDHTYTYEQPFDLWFDESSNMVTPNLEVAEAAFFNLGPVVVPEPSTFTLLALGSLALVMARGRRWDLPNRRKHGPQVRACGFLCRWRVQSWYESNI